MSTSLKPMDEAFVRQVVVELYDEEVRRHPDGIRPEDAMAAIEQQVVEILTRIYNERSA